MIEELSNAVDSLELAKTDRETMDPEIRKRFDEVRIAGLERVERILSLMEGRR